MKTLQEKRVSDYVTQPIDPVMEVILKDRDGVSKLRMRSIEDDYGIMTIDDFSVKSLESIGLLDKAPQTALQLDRFQQTERLGRQFVKLESQINRDETL